jgi:hypothetical protein
MYVFHCTNCKVENFAALKNNFKLQSGSSTETSAFFHHVTWLDVVLDRNINSYCSYLKSHKPLINIQSTLH